MKNVTIVTGGTGGMGFAAASIMAKYGPVVLCDIGEERLQSSCEILKRQNLEAHYAVCDVSKLEEVQAAVEKAGTLGRIKNVIHTAGLSPIQVSGLEPVTAAEKIINVDALGTIHMVESCYPVLEEGAVMICISSSTAHMIPHPYQPELKAVYENVGDREVFGAALKAMTKGDPNMAYFHAKCFVRHYVEMNASRFGHKGCRLLSIAPGRIATPMHLALVDKETGLYEEDMAQTPLHRYGGAYEIGQLAEFLCSDHAAFLHGIDVLIDGGYYAATSAATQIQD